MLFVYERLEDNLVVNIRNFHILKSSALFHAKYAAESCIAVGRHFWKNFKIFFIFNPVVNIHISKNL